MMEFISKAATEGVKEKIRISVLNSQGTVIGDLHSDLNLLSDVEYPKFPIDGFVEIEAPGVNVFFSCEYINTWKGARKKSLQKN